MMSLRWLKHLASAGTPGPSRSPCAQGCAPQSGTAPRPAGCAVRLATEGGSCSDRRMSHFGCTHATSYHPRNGGGHHEPTNAAVGKDPRRTWSKVSVRERAGRPHLYLRWWDGTRGNWHWQSLGHSDRALGDKQSRELAATLMATANAEARGQTTVAAVFARFEAEVTAHESPVAAAEDRRRIAIWTRAETANRGPAITRVRC